MAARLCSSLPSRTFRLHPSPQGIRQRQALFLQQFRRRNQSLHTISDYIACYHIHHGAIAYDKEYFPHGPHFKQAGQDRRPLCRAPKRHRPADRIFQDMQQRSGKEPEKEPAHHFHKSHLPRFDPRNGKHVRRPEKRKRSNIQHEPV